MANKPAQSSTQTTGHSFDDPFQLSHQLKPLLAPKAKLLLALSGGVDSVVLLDQLVKLKPQLNFVLEAMHIHHGISPNADQWASHCQSLCDQYQVPLTIQRLQLTPTGLGLEATAREARYQALDQYQDHNCAYPDYILTAHHQSDQAETVLLQLFRGAGVKGVSGMPLLAEHQRLLRPMLSVSKESILSYAKQHQLNWVEDESNQDTQFTRNFIRQEVMPLLTAQYPKIEQTLSAAAAHFAEAEGLNQALAELDAAGLIDGHRLNLLPLKPLPIARLKNVIRYWFALLQLPMPSAARLSEVVDQLFNSALDANIKLSHLDFYVMRYDNQAYLMPQSELPSAQAYEMVWQGEKQLSLPNGYTLQTREAIGEGIALKHLNNKLVIRSRQGGERLKLHQERPVKQIKQLFKEGNIPPWLRPKYPMLYSNDQFIGVPALGYQFDLLASEPESGLIFEITKTV